jgi:predicted ester cyclase
MSTEENKALFRRFVEQVANQGDLSVVDELLIPTFVEHEVLPPGTPSGRDGVKHFFQTWRRGFPDGRVTLDLVIAEGDLVTAYETWTGIHAGEFMGIPASGKSVKFQAVDIIRVVDGEFVEHWGISDTMSLMQQLGVIPPPEQAAG